MRNYLVQATRSGSTRCYSNDSSKVKSTKEDSSSSDSSTGSLANDAATSSSSDSFPPYPDPNLCCRDGCANCVWIEYAKELEKYHKDSDLVIREIEKQIDDPSIKAFIIMQVRESLERKD